MQEAKAPDGGWGWVVAFCSFANHMLIFGILLSMGVVYVAWLEEFSSVGKSTTSWIISIWASMIFLSGPLAGSAAARYGYRFAAMLGGLLSAAGLFMCYFATSVFYLIIAIGVFTGVGCGLVYLSSLAIVVIYFDKKRALASGIGISGAGIGSVCLPPLMNSLMESYGWRGCLLIIGGLLLNMSATGALMRPLVFKGSYHGKDKHVVKSEEENATCNVDEGKRDGKRFEDMVINYVGEGFQKTIGEESDGRLEELRSPSTEIIDHRENQEGLVSRKDHGDVSRVNDTVTSKCAVEEDDHDSPLITRITQIEHCRPGSCYNLECSDTAANESAVNYCLLSHSEEIITTIADFDNSKLHTCKEMSLFSKSAPMLRTISMNNCYENFSPKSIRKTTSGQVVDKAYAGMHSQVFRRNCHFSLSTWKDRAISSVRLHIKTMQDWAFLLFAISQILLTFSFITPVVYMVDRAIVNGITQSQGAWLVSCNGFGSLVGRLLFGVVADRFKTCRLMFYIVLLSISGVFTMMSPLCGGSLILHAAYAATFGFGMGGISTLSVVVLVDLVGLPRMATALGIVLWFAGIGHLLGPPIAGFIVDVTQTYTICYMVQGFVLACSGLMLIPIFRIRSGLCCNTEASLDMS